LIRKQDQFYLADGAEDIRREVEKGGEPYVPHVEALVQRAIPAEVSVYEYWQLNRKKVAAQQRQLKKWTDFRSPSGRKIDIVISPTMPHLVVPHRSCRWVGYTKIWNVLDYTALTMPVRSCVHEAEEIAPQYEPRNEIDRWNWELYGEDSVDSGYLSIQLIGRRLEEEKVLGAAKVLEQVLG
jgi:amidase